MTRPVTLSEAAFAALKKEKRNGESSSDVILRLIRDSPDRKDPARFLRMRLKRRISIEEHERLLNEMRELDTPKTRNANASH